VAQERDLLMSLQQSVFDPCIYMKRVAVNGPRVSWLLQTAGLSFVNNMAHKTGDYNARAGAAILAAKLCNTLH
jgi:hypothetical protein